MEAQSSRIKHLDGMRGIAILLVLFFHTFVRWPDFLPFVEQTKDIFLFKYGHIGVRFFFIISGFVIFMSLDKTASMGAFFKKRWLRLFPAMLIASIFIFLTAHFFHERPGGIPHLINLIPGLTFVSPEIIHSLFGVRIEGLEGAFWSIYVEVMFYIFSGFLYFSFGRKVILKSLFVTALIPFSLFHFFHQTLDDVALRFTVLVGFDAYIWFYIGCFMYEKINKRSDTIDNVMMVFAVVGCLYVASKDVKLLVITSTIIGMFCFSFYSELIKKILTNRALLFFGFISYPLYLIHENMIISSTIKMLNTFHFGRYEYLSPIIPMIFIFLFSYLIASQEVKLKNLLISIGSKAKSYIKKIA
ncbi:TPA: acyltransferase family protein [Yersinia enterocolitica]